jgi:hypothetical protein
MKLWNVLQTILKHLPAAAQTAATGATLFLTLHIHNSINIKNAPTTVSGSSNTVAPSHGNGNTVAPSHGNGNTVAPSHGNGNTVAPSHGNDNKTIIGSPSGKVTQGNHSPISGDTVNLSIRGEFTIDNSETVNIDMSIVATGGATNIQNIITSLFSPSNSVGGGNSGSIIFVPSDSDQPLPPIQSTSLPPLGMGGMGLTSWTTIQKTIYSHPSPIAFSPQSIPLSLVEALQPNPDIADIPASTMTTVLETNPSSESIYAAAGLESLLTPSSNIRAIPEPSSMLGGLIAVAGGFIARYRLTSQK